MRYGETGFNLEIDLSRGSVERVETDPRLTELYLGGLGTNDKILWDRVPPEVGPFSPDNLLIWGTGPLTGTPVPGGNRIILTTISPQNNFHAHSIMGGYFGAELKYAGYDKIVIRGKAPDLVYLWINNDKVEIRDATHLRGKGCLETATHIKQELKNDKVQVAAIGLGGENRVYQATIESGCGSASRGVGVIMGDKMLKAIAVRGTKDINIAHPVELFEKCQLLSKGIMENPMLGDWMSFQHNDSYHHDNFSWGNARTRRKGYWNQELEDRWKEQIERLTDRQTSCFNCPKPCRHLIAYPGKQRFFQKCFSKDSWHMAAYLEQDFSWEMCTISIEYGLDSYSTPQVCAFVIELLEAGILTDQDLPGFPPDPRGRFFYLVEKIARREGIGDILANGVSWAARHIGKGAEAYDHNTVKNFEQVPIKLAKLNPVYFLMTATGEKMTITQIEGSFPQNPLPTREQRQAFVDKWYAVPNDRYKQIFMDWDKKDHISVEAACEVTGWNEIMHYIDDISGLCGFLSSFRGQFGQRPDLPTENKPVYHIHSIPPLISLVTGMDIDEDRLWRMARRTRMLVRAINVRRGLRRKDDKAPKTHWILRDPELEEKLMDGYYKYQGWNNDGIPTKEGLHEMDLDYISEDLIRRGILTDSEGALTEEIPVAARKK